MKLYVKKHEIGMRIPGTDTVLKAAGGPYSEDEIDDAVVALKEKLKDDKITTHSESDSEADPDNIELVIEDVYVPVDIQTTNIYPKVSAYSITNSEMSETDDTEIQLITVDDVMYILTRAYEVHTFDVKIQDERTHENDVFFKSTNDLVLDLYRDKVVKEFRLTDHNTVVFTLYSCTDSTI